MMHVRFIVTIVKLKLKLGSYDKTLPNISKIVNKNWNILQIKTEFLGVFQPIPMITFRCSKNLQKIIGLQTAKEKFLRKSWSD